MNEPKKPVDRIRGLPLGYDLYTGKWYRQGGPTYDPGFIRLPYEPDEDDPDVKAWLEWRLGADA